MPSLPDSPLLTTVSRSGRVESWHRGAVAVWHGDALWWSLGAVERPVVCRSATKPLQALPFFERGLDERLGLDAQEVAVMCASHEGTEVHTAAVRRLLQRAGFAEDQLGCGPHQPFDAGARRQLAAGAAAPTKVHNNCSGKHAGFLHLARDCGDALADYLDPGCRSQTEVMAAVAAMAGVDLPVERGVDGCGAPTFVLPLVALARAFARLANPSAHAPVRAAACRRILAAVGREPELLAGPRRMCTALVHTARGAILPKNGAEGVYAVALGADARRPRCPGPVGIAIKVDDGSERGYQPVILDLLRHLGHFAGGVVPASLQPYWVQPVVNTRSATVGEVRCAVDWGWS